MQEYEITKDEFGIHTFELLIPYMKKKSMDAILERMHKEPSNTFYDDGTIYNRVF